MKSGGVIFPNKLPLILFKFLKNFPYEIPILGISNIYLGYL